MTSNKTGVGELVLFPVEAESTATYENATHLLIAGNSNYYGGEAEKQVIETLLILLSSYLSIVTTFYLHKHSDLNLKLSNNLIAISAVLLFLQCCWFEVESTLNEYTDSFCTAYLIINVSLASVMRTIVYSVLWLRQRGVYKNPLQKIDGKRIKIISYVTLIGILTCACCQIIVLVLVPQYAAAEEGCESGVAAGAILVISPVVFSLTSLFQILLLGLTLYPVITHMRDGTLCNNNKKLAFIAKKLSICTAICVGADIMFVIVTFKKPPGAPVSYIPFCYAFNSVINITVTLLSFVNYRIRLWPFRPPIQEQSSTQPRCRVASNTDSRTSVVMTRIL